MFYNPAVTFSHNCFLSMVVSLRGAGKTFSTLKWCVTQFLEKGEQFVYLRRSLIELQNVEGVLFNALEAEGVIKPGSFFCKGGVIFYKEPFYDETGKENFEYKVAGFLLAISGARQYKSAAYPLVQTIIFEEFIDENGKYLKDEVTKFLSIVETVGRMRNIRVIALANLTTKYNPYFLYFNMKFNSDREFTKDKKRGVLIHHFKSDEYQKKKLETPFAKLIQGTEYGDFILSNKNILDKDDFVKKFKNLNKEPLWDIVFENITFTVYKIKQDLYCEIGSNKNSVTCINMDNALRENCMNHTTRNPVVLVLKKYAVVGRLWFSDGNLKVMIEEILYSFK